MICNRSFSNDNELISHFIEMHSNNQTIVQSSTPTSTVYTPQVTEVQEMNFGEISNKTATDVLNRTGNEVIGEVIIPKSGKRKLKCKDCDYIAESKYFLTKHRAIHRDVNLKEVKVKGQRSNVCKELGSTKFVIDPSISSSLWILDQDCGFQGKSKYDLFKHRRDTHLPVKEFKCDQCNYVAREMSVLKAHM